MTSIFKIGLVGALLVMAPVVAAADEVKAPATAPAPAAQNATYIIGPGDDLQIFVWKNPDLSTQTLVRPDGRITAPLVQDIEASGKTPAQLAADLTVALSSYVQNPNVSVVVRTVAASEANASVRIIGTAGAPKTVPFRSGLTVLDAIIELGGLPIYANGNSAKLIRTEGGKTLVIRLRLNDLVNRGRLDANVALKPGDVIRIPERWF